MRRGKKMKKRTLSVERVRWEPPKLSRRILADGPGARKDL
jgi:hypothetical protein